MTDLFTTDELENYRDAILYALASLDLPNNASKLAVIGCVWSYILAGTDPAQGTAAILQMAGCNHETVKYFLSVMKGKDDAR